VKLQAYDNYKPSGIGWLGDVPKHWETKPMRRLGDSIIGLTYSPENIVEENEGILVLRSSNLQGGKITRDDNVFVNAVVPQDLRTRPGDILICSRNGSRDLVGKCAKVYPVDAGLTFGAFTTVFRSDHSDFLFYVLNSSLFSFQAGLYQTSTIYQLTTGTLNSMIVPIPPKAEQRAIADFLDRETARLDTLVGKKRELIEKLKEKRTALISRTVTGSLPSDAARAAGFNPHPKLKPSGIEWLGDIPATWEMMAVRRVATRVQTGSTPPTADERYYEDGSIAWFGPGSFDDSIALTRPVKLLNESAVADGTARLFRAGATMIVTIGATVGKVSSLDADASSNQQITGVEFNEYRVLPRYATYQLKRLESTLRAVAPSATLPILAQDEIARLYLAVPSVSEQRAIADYLDRETAKIDRMMEKVEAAIEKLQEYRTALITAAVTGKIDVRKASKRAGSTLSRTASTMPA
jgi:type I restriction enzyme S subunit